MSTARFILVALICSSPAILLWDGAIMQGLVAGAVAIALIVVARTMYPGEIGFLVSIIRPLIPIAAIPAVWVILQALPLGVLSHPIWKSTEVALGHAVAGAISVDPGASFIALGQYLSMSAIVVLGAAVAVDRQRAESVLLALGVGVTVIALMVLAHHLFFPGAWLAAFERSQAADCTSLGTIITSAACIRTIERYETRSANPLRSVPIVLCTLAACGVGLAICGAAVILATSLQLLVATGGGLLAFACMTIVRRFRLGLLGAMGIIVPILGGSFLALAAAHPLKTGAMLPIAFAAPASPALFALNERVLDEAPIVGTGAGTFAALAAIYREMDDPPAEPVAMTTAADFAIELGRPMLWLIAAAAAGSVVLLLRASLRRGRDFYSAMGGSCLTTLVLLGFINNGILGTACGVIAAASIGLAVAQSKSRTARQ